MSALEKIFFDLGLNKNNGLFITREENWLKETSFPNRVKRLIEKKIEPDAFFCFDNKPMVLFFENRTDKEKLHKAIWNFNECPIAIFADNGAVEIFNGFNYLKDKASLEKIGGIDKLNHFTYFGLVTGKTWEQYQNELNYKNRVDYHLLENIKSARKLLIERPHLKNHPKIVNSIIGKSIFVRYLIDREVKMRYDGTLRKWNNSEFCELFNSTKEIQEFFNYLEDSERGFNGDLFPLSLSEYKNFRREDYQVIKRLLEGADIAMNQPSLFQFYDFSIIPIEFISNVYELFIGQDNQKKEGAYYTPLFLVDYILKETVEKRISKKNSNFNCKVLDPACGSGIFLVESLRKIIEKYIRESECDVKSQSFKTAIKNLAKDNIFGIDKDLSAVQVAVFSIYLTLLDYLDPPGIETFKFPVLLNSNFFEADFFDQSAHFNVTLKEIEFDFILGNPPWKGNGMDDTGNKYLQDRKKNERSLKKRFPIAINNNEIAEGFILRVSDFSKKDTKSAFIIRSSSLYNLGYNDTEFSPFRQYLLEEFFIDSVFELAPVRHEVFEKSNQPAIAPAAIIFYRYAQGENTDKNIITHISLKRSRFFSLFKIFTINRIDFKQVQQSKFKEFDWLWKVLVYGSYLDFNFIKRLKEEYSSIKEIISDENKFVVSTGLHSRSNPLLIPKDLSGIKNIPFLKTSAIESFHIDFNAIVKIEPDKIDIVKDERIYRQPMLLVREGIDMASFTAKCSISKKDILFKDSITSIKAVKNNEIEILKNIAAIYSSSLFAYYAVNVFASIGIERERVKNYNKFSLPYIDLKVESQIDFIEKAHKEIYSLQHKTLNDNFKIRNLEKEINENIGVINQTVNKTIDLTEIETSLIDYALDINRQLITNNGEVKNHLFASLSFKDDALKIYATLFSRRFKPKLDNEKKKFIVEVWHTNQIVGMFFKMISVSEYSSNIVWENKQGNDTEIISLLTQISSERITDKLFVQKDIRGFEKDYFYIFKPNEKRLWHKAIGYLDVNEFADAILKKGIKAK
ncbi:MAG TPA: N-6 DNA methylase [Bacteroidia bacterium]|nr:N-6 DNA methylase [Bacteroidia bacterium]